MAEPLKIGVLISGSGTTLENFCRRIDAGTLNARVAVVISSKPGVLGIARAEKRGVPTAVINRSDFASGDEFSTEVTKTLDRYGVGLVCLAGFLVRWKMPEKYAGRVMNIHPALIPAFCGKGFYGHFVHEAVLESGVKVSGCTVHFADTHYDRGPIIVQKCVPVLDGDTPDTLAARVFEQECEAYPEAINLFAAGRLRIEGRRVHILSAK